MKTKVAVFGGVMGAALALTGCMGATGSATSELGWVPSDIEGRTDLFLVGDRLMTASQLDGRADAIQVEVDITELTVTATRFDTDEVLATWHALGEASSADLPMATPIDGELNPDDGPVTLPNGEFPRFRGGAGTVPNGHFGDDRPGLVIDWGERFNGIPDSTDAELWRLEDAHPGCA